MIFRRTLGRAAAVLLLVLAGCASNQAPEEGQRLTGNQALEESQRLIAAGREEEGVALLEKAARENPNDQALRSQLFRQREMLINLWIAQADALRQGSQIDPAEFFYRRVLALDGANSRAKAGLEVLQRDRQHRILVGEAELLLKADDVGGAGAKVRSVLAENPTHREARSLQRRIDERAARPVEFQKLKSAFTKPITLQFRDANLRSVFEAISRTADINFVFDRDVRPDLRTTLSVKDTTIDDVVKMILVTNQLERKIVNENTVIIFPNTPAKLKDYQELVVKSFYLANADVKQTMNMIRTLVKTRDVFIDEKLNLLVMKDTPEAVRMAERLIAAQDLAEPEVMLEVEVLEIGTSKLLDLGVRWPEQVQFQDPATVPAPGVSGTVAASTSLQRVSAGLTAFVATPALIVKINQQDGTTSILANPRIRVKNREKAKIHIGERVPVITTTLATGGFSSESVSYLDVGLKLEVEPTIFLDEEVGIKVGLEVSNIVKEIRTGTSGTLVYQIGTRNAATVLRLRDGETQILAGLIGDEDRRSASGLPGLTNMPILGRLFSVTSDQKNRTEIVLLITPRLMRTLARPEARFAEFPAGTDSATGAGPLTTATPSAPAAGVQRQPPAAPAAVPGAPVQPAPGLPRGGFPGVPRTPGVNP